MPRVLRREIDIEALPEVVWAILTDFAHYQEWNPFMVQSSGQAAVGTRLVNTMVVGKHRTTFRPIVTVAEESRAMEWLGRLGPGGLFDGRHRFTLEPLPGGSTRFVQEERFSGILVPLFGRVLRQTGSAFDAMNAALAVRAAAGMRSNP